ncbi:MAG: aminotransferase [Devosia sp. 67-54]|uniref:SIS domain-containing protein n=1 Tax=unclassified Devosia TaxID=196773 RepID=UPI000962B12C|nr:MULTISPECIES: SIS domain-containing protein [unclassified Devosia]MBN9306437.1 SIS domain-containing protein [Devosia sp.]OJX18490.1 MAG: aminotransferase [Devosia sp. 67-54]
MTNNATHMRIEIEEIPDATRRLLDQSGTRLAEAGAALKHLQPVMVATIARGSSDHAAAYLKYAIELVAGVPVASIGPSIMSIYGRELQLDGCAAISISQSGKSPDIVAMAESAKRNGALGIALTNTADSPLAAASNITVDLSAGKEQSVAATKSFVSSVVAGLGILGHWTGDAVLLSSLKQLPDAFTQALDADWTPFLDALGTRDSLYVLGRGPAFAIAQEAALKFKETCGIHAEAYSAAEVLHGPARIVEAGFPVLALAARDASEAAVAEIADRLAKQGATAFATTTRVAAARQLPFAPTGHPITDGLSLIVSFYGFVEKLSRARGLDPDHPPHLKKVTETV